MFYDCDLNLFDYVTCPWHLQCRFAICHPSVSTNYDKPMNWISSVFPSTVWIWQI